MIRIESALFFLFPFHLSLFTTLTLVCFRILFAYLLNLVYLYQVGPIFILRLLGLKSTRQD